MTDPLTRRAVIAGMAALHMLALTRIAQAQTPLAAQSGPVDMQAFMAFSQHVTGHEHLSPALGARILAVLTENGQAAPLETLYDAVSQTPDDMSADNSEVLRLILYGWYLGRITIDDMVHLTGFEDTLMGRVTADILPLRSFCGGTMGFWTDPPATGPLPLPEGSQ